MTTKEAERKCLDKQNELIEKYFGNLIHEAAVERSETIGDYTDDLPKKVEAEYYSFLEKLWAEVAPDDPRPLEQIINKRHLSELMTENMRENVKFAYDDALRRDLWERITKTNHEDVTFYKGLLKMYTKELLTCLRVDFVEDLKGDSN